MTNKNLVYKVTQMLNNEATESDLKELNAWIVMKIKQERSLKAVRIKDTLKVGMRVNWTGRKGNHTGEIIKINRTRAQVRENDFMVWNVPMGMLHVE